MLGDECDPLRLLQSSDAVHGPAAEIYHLNGIIAQRGDEQPMPFQIHGEMVDPPPDAWKLDGLYPNEGLAPFGRPGRDRQRADGRHEREKHT